MTITEGHQIDIHIGQTGTQWGEPATMIYQALCSCGYAGPPFFSKPVAETDGKEHVFEHLFQIA